MNHCNKCTLYVYFINVYLFHKPLCCHTAINATTFNGEMNGNNQVYGIPDNSLEQTTSTNLTNTSTMRSDIAEFENTLYASVQSAEVNNPDDEDIDLKDFSLFRLMQ